MRFLDIVLPMSGLLIFSCVFGDELYVGLGKSILRDLTLQFVNLIILSKDTILLRHLIRRMERSLEFRTERTGIFQWEIPRGLLRHFPGGCPFSPS